MDSLPEECLDLILRSIPPHRPLYPLLLVSRTFFRLVLPLLYQNPFDHIDRVPFAHPHAHQRKTMALSLLLHSSPEPLFEGLTLYPGGWPYQNPATVDYLSYYTRHSEKHLQNFVSLVVPDPTSTPLPRLAQTSSPSSSSSSPSIKARIHLGFVGHNASHLQSLCFSLHKLGMLIPLIPQLTSLTRLELYIPAKVTADTGALHFITAHTSAHPGLLREIKIEASGWGAAGGAREVAQHVEAVGGQVQVVDVTGWIEGVQFLSMFPSDACKSLLLRQTVPPRLEMPGGLPEAVQRFHKLEKLRFPAVDAALFAWAVTTTTAAATTQEESVKMTVRPPLASLDLHGADDHLIPALSDATNAFRATMREIKGLSSFGPSSGRVLEWGWELPRLTQLDLEGTVAVRFNLLALQHCPALRVLRLNIGRQIPDTWDPQIKARELAECLAQTQVASLELSGYWDVSDADLTREETMLQVLRRLTRLNLMWCRGPTIEAYAFLMREMRMLKRLHVSGTLAEKERLLGLKKTLELGVSLDIEARG
ncbi:hypothetical protein MVEG_10453 [Podila verticillata NRRL 6337]|nr:hypothetical protein MVEG_10453 [Podila verticillata NRRL 6337]